MSDFTPIPQPPPIPLLGNIREIDAVLSVNSFKRLASQYGSIYQLDMLGRQLVVVNTQKLSHQVADESRFRKTISPILEEVRNLAHDGLFTAYWNEPNWGKAHRILMPAFGPAAIREMYDDMVDVASQLILKWYRMGPKAAIDPVDDFTRLTFDTICLSAANFRVNSYYTEKKPEFLRAMGDFLVECGSRARRPTLLKAMMIQTNAQFASDIKLMEEVASDMISERLANPIDHQDPLNRMLLSKDPKTGETLSLDNVRNQLITFLIAGHETTGGTLSFTLYNLVKYPEVQAKVQAEIDEVVGDRLVTLDDLPRLKYLAAVLRETLRLSAPIIGRGSEAIEDTFITDGDKKYEIKKTAAIFVFFGAIHKDTSIYGDDAEEFKPERMLDENFNKLPPNAWEPFGNGMRSCIGRAFAWQEILIFFASLLQAFDIRADDPSYILQIQQTLTVKPTNFRIRAIPRPGRVPIGTIGTKIAAPTSKSEVKAPVQTNGVKQQDSSPAFYVYYGSNTGSGESFAQRLATTAGTKGYRVKIDNLDASSQPLPTDGPVVVITASFEGEPADNAAHFVHRLKSLSPNDQSLKGGSYAVFGCGNHDWVHTYQKIPRLCDELLEANGATRLLERGEGDAGGTGFFESFDDWETKLWEVVSHKYPIRQGEEGSSGFEVKLSQGTERASILKQDASLGVVVSSRILTKGVANVKCHIEIALPSEMEYKAGDYLAILPVNPPSTVFRVLKRFDFSREQEVTIFTKTMVSLPTNKSVLLTELLSGYVELAQPVTKKNLQTLIGHAEGEVKKKLEALLDDFTSVQEKRTCVLDILEESPTLDLPFSEYLQMLPAMRIRQYSISSSPLCDPTHCTLTFGVLDAPSLSHEDQHFLGVGSNYLAQLQAGDRVQLSIRPSAAAFHLPEDPSVPLILFAAGSGIAPMRGFIQERAIQAAAGRPVGKILLFFGCRDPELDFLYSDRELSQWTRSGIVEVLPAFSRASDKSEGCKYVQDRVWHERAKIVGLFNEGAKIYTCGSSKVANGIKDVCVKIITEAAECKSHTIEDAEAFFRNIQKERYATDVFG